MNITLKAAVAATMLTVVQSSPVAAQTGVAQTGVAQTGAAHTGAAQTGATGNVHDATTRTAPSRYVFDAVNDARASKVVGSTVYNEQNEPVGTLDDILIARHNKQPMRAIISVGGFLGMGTKLVEVNYDQLRLGENNKVVLPSASKAELSRMPAFSYNTIVAPGAATSAPTAPAAPTVAPAVVPTVAPVAPATAAKPATKGPNAPKP